MGQSAAIVCTISSAAPPLQVKRLVAPGVQGNVRPPSPPPLSSSFASSLAPPPLAPSPPPFPSWASEEEAALEAMLIPATRHSSRSGQRWHSSRTAPPPTPAQPVSVTPQLRAVEGEGGDRGGTETARVREPDEAQLVPVRLDDTAHQGVGDDSPRHRRRREEELLPARALVEEDVAEAPADGGGALAHERERVGCGREDCREEVVVAELGQAAVGEGGGGGG